MKHIATLVALIAAAKGRFFSVKFRTKDGKLRVMNGKDFYRRLVKGGENTLRDTQFVPAVDRNKDAFRAINSAALIEFKCGEIRCSFIG